MPIPKIIHQLWKDDAPPARYHALIATWKRHHAGWDYHLWTDVTLRAFVAEHYSSFLPIYDGYERNICRADAGRYLVLKHFGGLYADLDAEALRPFDDLIADTNFVIGYEPAPHLQYDSITKLGLPHLLCPTVIASTPQHPFWDDVLKALRARPRSFDVLELTGPALLTRVYQNYTGAKPVTPLPEDIFYPFTKDECWRGDAFDIALWEEKTRNAYALHHWDGTWFRDADGEFPALPQSFPLTLTDGAPGDRPRMNTKPPLITCMMVTRNRYHLARHALNAFLKQTYAQRELLVIDDGTCTKLADDIARRNDPRLRLIRPRKDNLPLGALRNLAVENARGDYVCQWDDDDLSDPRRLEIQLASLLASGARASFLSRWLIWQPQKKRMMVSSSRIWEGSMLCEREIMPRYTDLRRGEDTAVADTICARHTVAHIDIPRLYVYVGHGGNTFEDGHFDALGDNSKQKFEGARYDSVLNELEKRVELKAYAASLAQKDNTGINLFGMFRSATGLGSGARGLLAAIQHRPHTLIDLQNLPDERARDWATLAPHPVTLLYTNPDLLDLFFRTSHGQSDLGLFKDRHVIGCWAFESQILPDTWKNWLTHFDEIWVPSQFVANCLAPHVTVPIHVVPVLDAPAVTPLTRTDLDLPAGDFIFLTLFDELSGFTRKNALGSIEAYIRAFPVVTGATRLILKARSLSGARHREIDTAIGVRDDIELRIGEISQIGTTSLIANCNCVLSLHRAEGFGLVIAEAMQQGCAIIATGWSGNAEFSDDTCTYRVRYTLGPLTEQTDQAYAVGTIWAEPDLVHAANLMAELAATPAKAVAIGARAKAHIAKELALSKITALVESRLDPITPSVLILTPFKNAAHHLPRYFELLNQITHDKRTISLGFIEGDSSDATYADLEARLPDLKSQYARVTLIKEDAGLSLTVPRWETAVQRTRRSTIARARNHILSVGLRDETWVLWLDADLTDYPPDLLTRLIAADKDIIVPRCTFADGRDHDLNSFVFDPARGQPEDPAHLIDDIWQPPIGAGRTYLSALPREESPVPVDSIGGTALLIRAQRHREDLVFPEVPYRGYIETEGLAMLARDRGLICWALPSLQIIHSDE